MNLLVPAALAFSAIIPIILLLYFMRPKRQERTIGSTLLWRQALQDLQASRPWQRLRITPLLLLQLLAAIVIVLILARPAIFSSSPITGNTVIILQASASMQATDVAPSRFENARSSINDFIDTLGPNDRLSLITMAHTPQVLIADSADKNQLHAAVQRARVTNQDADLEQALSLATSLAQGRANAQILVIGDGHVINPNQQLIVPVPVRYMRVGTDAPNAALMALSARTQRGKPVAFAQVANYSHQQRSIPVELRADNRLVSVQTVTLTPGATGAVQWNTLPPNARFLHARLLTQDVMSVDHEAWAIVGSPFHGRVLLVTKGNLYLQTALRLQDNVDLFETTPDKYVKSDLYDLTIFDGFVPPTLPAGAIFFINPPNGSYPFGTSGQEVKVSRITPGSDTLNLLANMNLSSIRTLSAAHQIKPAAWAQPIIESPETPLLLAGEQNNKRMAVLAFDLHASDLPLQPSFPILVHNLTQWFLPPPVGGDGQIAPGVPVTIQLWPGADKVTITGPGADQQPVQVGPPVMPFTRTDQTGIYQVTQHVRGQNLNGAFVINLFNPAQSRLAPAKALPVLHSTDFTPGGNTISHELREIWPWIAALLLLVLCAEWWLFSRSYRQQKATSFGDQRTAGQGTALLSTGNTLLHKFQRQFEEHYRLTKKRFQKALRHTTRHTTKGNLVKQTSKTSKGNRHANV
ncbi:MAG: BatA and WFA domain-containing protein [Ktedonobacteraceae bacterium]|nr:BatA and WFA domain-containing protein [Ktedonobacteraceae bacterium]